MDVCCTSVFSFIFRVSICRRANKRPRQTTDTFLHIGPYKNKRESFVIQSRYRCLNLLKFKTCLPASTWVTIAISQYRDSSNWKSSDKMERKSILSWTCGRNLWRWRPPIVIDLDCLSTRFVSCSTDIGSTTMKLQKRCKCKMTTWWRCIKSKPAETLLKFCVPDCCDTEIRWNIWTFEMLKVWNWLRFVHWFPSILLEHHVFVLHVM